MPILRPGAPSFRLPGSQPVADLRGGKCLLRCCLASAVFWRSVGFVDAQKAQQPGDQCTTGEGGSGRPPKASTGVCTTMTSFHIFRCTILFWTQLNVRASAFLNTLAICNPNFPLIFRECFETWPINAGDTQLTTITYFQSKR